MRTLLAARLLVIVIPVGCLLPVPCVAEDCLSGVITTVVGGGPEAEMRLNLPTAVAVGPDGCLYIADMGNHCIRKACEGVVATVAGKGTAGYAGDGGPAAEACLNEPRGIALGSDGSLYIADSLNNRIAKVDPAGMITTVAGDGRSGSGGDGGPALQAQLNKPFDVAVDEDGSLYIADTKNHRVRKVDPEGKITTIAGRPGIGRYYGDGGPAAEARMNEPYGVMVGPDGSVYLADTLNHRVRRIGPDGIITTVAGEGGAGHLGDRGAATTASLHSPTGMTLDPQGALYIADMANYRVRKVGVNGVIATVAGGSRGYWGDGGAASEAGLNSPRDVALAADGRLYVVDVRNDRIRQIRWRPCDPEAARAAADEWRAKAGESPEAWREVADLYLIASLWDEALAAAERVRALAPETDGPASQRADILIARVHAAKRDDHEARRRLIRVLAQGKDPAVLRDAVDVLVRLYLLRGEREQAIATLTDLWTRTDDRDVRDWAQTRLGQLAG